MSPEERKQLAEFLQKQLHECYLPGHYFNTDAVLEEIDNFYIVKELIAKRDELIAKRDELQKQIDKLTK